MSGRPVTLPSLTNAGSDLSHQLPPNVRARSGRFWGGCGVHHIQFTESGTCICASCSCVVSHRFL
eukprot:453417-Amphidinium_carterae.1